MALNAQGAEYIGTTYLRVKAIMIVLALTLSVGWNVNLPTDRAFDTATVVQETIVHTCADAAVNVTNQYPQALVEVTGSGKPSCKWSAAKVLVDVTDNMPAAGAIRAVTAGIDCPADMMCPPSPCTLLEMDYQNYYISPGETDERILGATSCGPVFGRGSISGRYRQAGDFDVLKGADKLYYPGSVRVQALGGDTDLPGFTARSQLIRTHPRYTDVPVPVWSNIDGLGPIATGHYDFVLLSTTRNPTAGPFCDEFKASGYDGQYFSQIDDDPFTPENPTYNTTIPNDQIPNSFTDNDLSNLCRDECETYIVEAVNQTDLYLFLRERKSSQGYQCQCWMGDTCTRTVTADGSWYISNAYVGTTFARAHQVPLVRSGKISGNLPVRRISDIDITSEFECPNTGGLVWNVSASGITADSCKVHGYENHLLTCACFKYMLYRTPEPPSTRCCKWYTTPLVRSGPGFAEFDKDAFVSRRNTTDGQIADQLNNMFALQNESNWDKFWTNASTLNKCFYANCTGGRDPTTVLLGHSDRLAPCCPWFVWSNVNDCVASENCNNGGIEVGCTMTAQDLLIQSVIVPAFETLCQRPVQQKQPFVFSQFASGSLNDFDHGTLNTRTVPLGHLNRPLKATENNFLNGLGDTTDLNHPEFERVVPFLAINPGAGLAGTHGEPDVESAILAAFHPGTISAKARTVLTSTIRDKIANLRIWSVANTGVTAADPCWQHSKEATLSIDYDTTGSIKEILIVVDQTCVVEDQGCTGVTSTFKIGNTTNMDLSLSTGQTIQPLSEDTVEKVATFCQPPPGGQGNTCSLTSIPGSINLPGISPETFWNRYAATTGVHLDNITKTWAIPHESSDANEHQYCRWHYTVDTAGGWDTPPFPHTLPCTQKCRPLKYRKARTFSCNGPKTSVQQDPHAGSDEAIPLTAEGATVHGLHSSNPNYYRDYHERRPTIGTVASTRTSITCNGTTPCPNTCAFDPKTQECVGTGTSSDFYPSVFLSYSSSGPAKNLVLPDRPSNPQYNPYNYSNTMDFSFEICNFKGSPPDKLSRRTAQTQQSCKDNRANRLKQPVSDERKPIYTDLENVQKWEGWAASEQTCENEVPFKGRCEFKISSSSVPIYDHLNQAYSTTGFSRYDQYCGDKPQSNPLDYKNWVRFCEMSVWTHETTSKTNYEQGACPQELDASNYSPDDAPFNLYTPNTILGQTYRWLGPRPRLNIYTNPSYEYYDQNSPETGRNQAPSHCPDYPYIAIGCFDPLCNYCADDSDYCYRDDRTKKATEQMQRLANCKIAFAGCSNSGPPTGCGAKAFTYTTGNIQVPIFKKSLDEAFLQQEDFQNTLYACRCTKPTSPNNKWNGATMPDYLSPFNNRPVMYIKCCATDSSWSNEQSQLDSQPANFAFNNNYSEFAQREPYEWARTEKPKYRWVNYYDGWKAGTASGQAQCGILNLPVTQSPDYMPTVENGKTQRPKLDIVAPRGYPTTPEGPQQFVVVGIRLDLCMTNVVDNVSNTANLLGPTLAPVSHVTQDEPYVPNDYVDRPYFVFEPEKKQPQMCDCGSNKPVYACERYTADAMAGILPKCVGEAPDDGTFDCVACGWTWPVALAGQTFPLGLFLGSSNFASIAAMERDPLAGGNPKDFLRFFMSPGAPEKNDLIELITDVGNWGGDFSPKHREKQLGAISPNNKVHLLTYPGTCLRPPYGRVHRHALRDADQNKYFRYPQSEFGNGGLSELADETLYTYCETPQGFVYCENDPFGNERNEFCATYIETTDKIIFGHTLLKRPYPCNRKAQLCMYIQGDPQYGSFGDMDIPENATVLISPISWDILSSLQCGLSHAKLANYYSMSDYRAQTKVNANDPNNLNCHSLTQYVALEDEELVYQAYLQINKTINSRYGDIACDENEKGGPPFIAGERGMTPGRCFPIESFQPTIATRNNAIRQPFITVRSIDGNPIQVPAVSTTSVCASFDVQAVGFIVEQPLFVNNSLCDTGFGGAAIHVSGSSAKGMQAHVHLLSPNMAAAAIGYDEQTGRLSRLELDITDMQIAASGNLSASFVFAASRIRGRASQTFTCTESCNLMLYEGTVNAIQNASNLVGGSAILINVTSMFEQFALTPLRDAHHHWAGKLREITILYFASILIVAILLVSNTIAKAQAGLKVKTS